MVFWTAILIGAIIAYYAIKLGFYEALVMLFNIVISVYLAVYLRAIVVNVPAISDAPCCDALSMFGTAIAAFLVLHGISYTFLTGQFSIPFPRIFDTLGAACLGFLAGFLISSFLSLAICITPVSQHPIMKGIGFGSQHFEQTNGPYLYWWCDLVNAVVSEQQGEHPTKQAVSELLRSIEEARRPKVTKRVEPTKPAEPAEPPQVKPDIEEQLGPPPEIDFENI
ncbi:MAG: CvpA family protein [Planctomycetota bacterium]|nr:MAG: CvpA family protein [Planctomycetota bacterium]